MISVISMLFLLVIHPAGSNSPTDTFRLVRHQRGVKLFERWIAHPPGYAAREVLAQFVVSVSPDSVAAMLHNPVLLPRWNQAASQISLRDVKPESWILYSRYAAPWPISDQDCLLRHTLQRHSPSRTVISFVSTTHPGFPVQEAVDRMEEIQGSWEMIRLQNGQTQVSYRITTKPSRIPAWVTDPIVRNHIMDSMIHLSKMFPKTHIHE